MGDGKTAEDMIKGMSPIQKIKDLKFRIRRKMTAHNLNSTTNLKIFNLVETLDVR